MHLALALLTNTVSHVLIESSRIHFTQTLINLDLSENMIGDSGTQFLATVLKNNRVSHFFHDQQRMFSLFSFSQDSYNIKSSKKSDQR
jgi:hypothetical protein